MIWQQLPGVAAALAAAILVGWAASGASAAPKADFTVAPSGDDGNPGTAARPFATLARARDAVRQLAAKGLRKDVLVRLRGGTYRLTEPVVFGPADSGTEKHTITYAAQAGERPVLSGGRVIKGWRAAPGGARRVTIAEVKAGTWRFNELFVGGAPRPRARHPSRGYRRVVKVIDDRRSFQFAAGDLPALADAATAELVLLHDWSISRNPLASLDAKTRTLTTAHVIGGPMGFWRINGFEPKPRYFIEGAAELCDAPGEWHLDATTGVLTYRPLEGEKLAGTDVIAPVAKQLLVVRGEAGKPVRNLRFVGLAMEHCAWATKGVRYAGGQACFHFSLPTNPKGGWKWEAVTPAVLLEYAERCLFESCRLAHLGGSGIWLGRGCHGVAVTGCSVSDVGGNGVMIGEGAVRKGRDVAAGNAVTHSVIEHCGVLYYGAVGVWIGLSADNRIAHNEIGHHPYTGVSVGWQWNPTPTPCKANVLEHNHIHHVMQILSDGGGIYTLGRQAGTVLRGNWIHDVPLNAGRAESNGMFLDEGTTDIVIEGNLIHETVRSSLRFHKAGKNLVRNNVLAVGDRVPIVRYNATDSKNITLRDNTTVKPADRDGEAFRKALATKKRSTGPQAPWREKLRL